MKTKVTYLHERSKSESEKFNSRMAMIQMLIPLGLKAIEDELQMEVRSLVGEWYGRETPDVQRWGRNNGSVYLGDQKVSIKVPRVRNQKNKKEVQLKSYDALQSPGIIDELTLQRVIGGLKMGNYKQAAIAVPETFGISKSSVSRRYIRATAKSLEQVLNRDLSKEDIVSIFMDGKSFSGSDIVIALGITILGEKIILGFIETVTENKTVCKEFINNLITRGLNIEQKILFIIDGAKGLHSGITGVLGEKAVIQRCQWHKRENVLEYLNDQHKEMFRGKLQTAYQENTYEKAKSKLMVVKKELKLINESAVRSLEEGFEETLTLHKLGLFSELGSSFKTTNCIENVNGLLGSLTGRVTYWKNSNQRQRWIAAVFLEIEPGLRKVRGYQYLKNLRVAMKNLNQENNRKVA
ncbi:MAG: transposase [Patescibacteria group bacterium]